MNETREEQLINAGKAAEADKKVDVEALKKKYTGLHGRYNGTGG